MTWVIGRYKKNIIHKSARRLSGGGKWLNPI